MNSFSAGVREVPRYPCWPKFTVPLLSSWRHWQTASSVDPVRMFGVHCFRSQNVYFIPKKGSQVRVIKWRAVMSGEQVVRPKYEDREISIACGMQSARNRCLCGGVYACLSILYQIFCAASIVCVSRQPSLVRACTISSTDDQSAKKP